MDRRRAWSVRTRTSRPVRLESDPDTNARSQCDMIPQSHYASHPLVGTLGIPLVVYPGLKLNFLRPKFMREIEEFVSQTRQQRPLRPNGMEC